MRNLEMLQTLQNGNDKLFKRIHSIENDNHNLTSIYSIERGKELLTDKIPSKDYDRLAVRTLLLKGNLQAIHAISKDKKVALVKRMKSRESYVDDKKEQD